MIHIIQVYVYYTNNGCSVRIGRGYDHTEVLQPEQCEIFEFVEFDWEVKKMIKLISALPHRYRGKDDSLNKLKIYLQNIQ